MFSPYDATTPMHEDVEFGEDDQQDGNYEDIDEDEEAQKIHTLQPLVTEQEQPSLCIEAIDGI